MSATTACSSRASTLAPLASPGAHVAQLYRSDDDLVATVAALTADALAAGDSMVSIATAAHEAAVSERLRADGHGAAIATARVDGRYVTLDAERVLDRIVTHGHLVARRFDDVVGDVVERSVAAAPRRMVRAFGEMVAILAASERFDLALHLEEFWSDLLADGRRFSLLCGYPMALFDAASRRPRLVAVCGWHSHVGRDDADEASDDALGTQHGGGFSVRCRWCDHTLLVAPRIAEAEAAAIVAHLRAVHPEVAPPLDGPALGAVLREVVVDKRRSGGDQA